MTTDRIVAVIGAVTFGGAIATFGVIAALDRCERRGEEEDVD